VRAVEKWAVSTSH